MRKAPTSRDREGADAVTNDATPLTKHTGPATYRSFDDLLDNLDAIHSDPTSPRLLERVRVTEPGSNLLLSLWKRRTHEAFYAATYAGVPITRTKQFTRPAAYRRWLAVWAVAFAVFAISIAAFQSAFACVAPIVFVLSICLLLAMRDTSETKLRFDLVGLDHRLCRSCRYALDGLAPQNTPIIDDRSIGPDQCPECGCRWPALRPHLAAR